MVLGMLHLRDPAHVERWLLGGVGLVLGLALYFVAPYFYTGVDAVRFRGFVDGHLLLPVRRRRRGTSGEMGRGGEVDRPGRRVFVWHLPRASAVRDLGWTSDQGLAGMGVFLDYGVRPGRAQRVGDLPREICKRHARESNRRQEKACSCRPKFVGAAVSAAQRGNGRSAQPPLEPYFSFWVFRAGRPELHAGTRRGGGVLL